MTSFRYVIAGAMANLNNFVIMAQKALTTVTQVKWRWNARSIRARSLQQIVPWPIQDSLVPRETPPSLVNYAEHGRTSKNTVNTNWERLVLLVPSGVRQLCDVKLCYDFPGHEIFILLYKVSLGKTFNHIYERTNGSKSMNFYLRSANVFECAFCISVYGSDGTKSHEVISMT